MKKASHISLVSIFVVAFFPKLCLADKRVLMIGIDGAGGSYTQTANTPNLDALAANGAVSYDFLNEGALIPNPPEAYGASGVNWTTMNTGASAASHGVSDNGFGGNNLANVPHWFKHIKDHDPSLYTASIVNWAPINDQILPDQYADMEMQFSGLPLATEDQMVRDGVVNLLRFGDPNAIFVHFDQVDGAGHAFSWGSAQYFAAIQTVDSLIGDIMSALNTRPGVVNGDEDWLVLVSADHGAAEGAFSHVASQGLSNWEVPMVVSGPSVPNGSSLEQGTLRDMATTALWHLGILPYATTVEGDVIGIEAPFEFGDLNFDGRLDSDDWVQLQAGFGSPLDGLSFIERYNLSDINGDGVHNLDDILEFQISFDDVNGVGAFQAMIEGIPEPGTLTLLLCSAIVAAACRRHSQFAVVTAVFLLFAPNSTMVDAGTLFSENFDGLSLGSNVDEGLAGTDVWTDSPPSNWAINSSGVPSGGVTEWRGWSFADPVWWASTAGDQRRSEFTKASGAIAVADPDEWDDLPRSPGTYNTFLATPSIPLSGLAPNTVELKFDSSWRPEVNQTANISVSFDSGSPVELLRWTSNSGDGNFKPDSTNETVVIPVNNPSGAADMRISFGLFDAGNNWWWAIDNLEVLAPLTLQVDVQTGEMTILGDSQAELKGYEIVSPGGSNAPAGWMTGNLDAQDIGQLIPAASDFDANNVVDAADLAIWDTAYGTTPSGDADSDGDSDGFDFLRWQNENGLTGDAGSTWLTFLATENQLIEAYLLGSSKFASDTSIGFGYDTAKDLRDLQFTYTNNDNEKVSGSVVYVNVPGAVFAVPEAASLGLVGVAIGQFVISFRSPRARA